DVELAVQLLQMVHGRSNESLRSPSTLEALRELGDGGYVARTDAAGLVDAYRFLRTVEHRLQMRKLLRTHLFPKFDDTEELHVVARGTGWHCSGRSSAVDMLRTEFVRPSNRTQRLERKLGSVLL